ncbi:NAD(P)-binding domain-containing protein [Chryseobacterium sp. POL2]|uniref:NADPH-dependent F420 reductase n=1 Tax=Chryseobacterium TaxID=59732 RepID=UPI0013E19FFC|nr:MULTISPECIES: NAD(P)-binding domain-containing protein [Chryseobacterium]MDM1554215.1 NAD(P)-binding domain-containing protein [Chryseobacterium indologenes]QIG89703.1 NAD(P)-binding domain-containing protein [Chryseobacterium sp. POL2]
MKIGIIGAGNMGQTLTKHFVKAGHEVSIANSKGAETLQVLASQIGIEAVSVYKVARENELIIIAIPQSGILKLPKDLFNGVSDDVIVIDNCNYFPLIRDGIIEELESDLTNSEWVSKIIGRPVIKVFNSINFKSLAEKARPKGDPERIALSVSGDNSRHKEIIRNLLDQIGFDFYDNGLLKNSWKQEPVTPAYCTDLTLPKLTEAMQDFYQQKTAEAMAYIREQRKIKEENILKEKQNNQ